MQQGLRFRVSQLQVARGAARLVEEDFVGAERVRRPDLMYSNHGAAPQLDDVPCYDAKNPRHTKRELARYISASKKVFKDVFFLI